MSKASDIINDNPKAGFLSPRELYDESLLGLSSDGRLIYSEDKILIALQDIKGLPYEEALDYYASTTIPSLANGNRHSPIIATQTA